MIKLARLSPVSRLRESRGEGDEDGANDNGGDVAGGGHFFGASLVSVSSSSSLSGKRHRLSKMAFLFGTFFRSSLLRLR